MPLKEKRLSKRERKLEKKRKALEKKRNISVNYLGREIKYGIITRKKHEFSWREFLSKIKSESLKDDLDHTWHTFEWALDVKDCTISALMDELNEANDQYLCTLRKHNSCIDLLIHQMMDGLDSLYKNYLKSLTDLKTYYYTHNCENGQKFNDEQETLKTLLYKMQCLHNETIRENQTQHFCHVEIMALSVNELEKLEATLDKKLRNSWTKSKELMNEYFRKHNKLLRSTEKERIAFDSSNIDNKRNVKKMVYLLDLVKKLQAKLVFLNDTDGEKLRHLEDTHEEFSNILFILKDKIFRDTQMDNAQRKSLVLNAHITLDHLKKITKKGEIILKYMSVNRRYETSAEKVFPYPVNKEFMKMKHLKRDQGTRSLEEKLLLFHQRIANVDASRVALMDEKKMLQLEKFRLQTEFEKYCCYGCIHGKKYKRRQNELTNSNRKKGIADFLENMEDTSCGYKLE